MTDKIKFVPGCFDNFEGTQEELDEFIDELTQMAEDGSLLTASNSVSLDELFDEDPALAVEIAMQLGILDDLQDENGDPVDADRIRDVVGITQPTQRKLN